MSAATLADLTVKLFTDGADKAQIVEMAKQPWIAGFTTNPSLLKKAGVSDYAAYGRDLVAAVPDRHISFEVFSDDIPELVAQGRVIASWGKNVYLKDIVALGDFNLPKAQAGDPIFDALTKRGLHLPKHSSEIGSSIASDSHYDQIAFFPGETENDFTGKTGIFDFDGALFKTLWDRGSESNFFAFMRYYISDHRIMWAEFQI